MPRARFGRRRRSSGNLSALVAQLYREQRAAEDRVMFDAYANGGLVDGKPVNDGRMRAYVAKRRDGFSKDDALYDEWNNRLIQLDFKIGEEKVTLSFQQGKVGAGAVASFYRQQLRNIPQDSAFYREVAGRAAQWAKAAVGAARGRARARMTAALQGKSDQAGKVWQDYSALEQYLTTAAKRAGLIIGNQTLTDADASDLEAFLQRGVPGPNGTTITFKDWRNSALSAYKAFDTFIAINKQLNRGTKTLIKDKAKFLDQNLVRINTIDDRSKYEAAIAVYDEAIGDGSDPRAVLDAAAALSATLQAIRDKALTGGGTAANDPNFLGALANTLNALEGKDTGAIVEDLYASADEGISNRFGTKLSESIAKAQEDVKALANGDAFYGQGEFGGKLTVQYFPPGAKLDPFGKNGLDDSTQPSILNIEGVPTQVYLKGQPVQAFGLVQPNGMPVGDTITIEGRNVPVANLTAGQIQQLLAAGFKRTDDPATVGFVFTDPTGKVTKFGIVTPEGMRFTTSNPFGNTLTPGENGFVLFSGSEIDERGAKPNLVTTLPDFATLGQGDEFLADESITVKDLLTLAANSKSATEAARLQALADRRQRNTEAERSYMNRANEGDRASKPIKLGGYIAEELSGVTDFVKTAAAPEPWAASGNWLSPPDLKPLAAPTFVAPPADRYQPTAPVPTTISSGKAQDDIYQPPSPPPSDAAIAKIESELTSTDWKTIQSGFSGALGTAPKAGRNRSNIAL